MVAMTPGRPPVVTTKALSITSSQQGGRNDAAPDETETPATLLWPKSVASQGVNKASDSSHPSKMWRMWKGGAGIQPARLLPGLLAPILIALRRASRIGDLDPAILCAPFVTAIVGDGFGLAVALGREPVRCDVLFRESRHHRLRPRFRKRLVIRVVADIVGVTLYLQSERLI